jgi:hypothetical protein
VAFLELIFIFRKIFETNPLIATAGMLRENWLSAAALLGSCFVALIWFRYINAEWVRMAANGYARVLLSACDRL